MHYLVDIIACLYYYAYTDSMVGHFLKGADFFSSYQKFLHWMLSLLLSNYRRKVERLWGNLRKGFMRAIASSVHSVHHQLARCQACSGNWKVLSSDVLKNEMNRKLSLRDNHFVFFINQITTFFIREAKEMRILFFP